MTGREIRTHSQFAVPIASKGMQTAFIVQQHGVRCTAGDQSDAVLQAEGSSGKVLDPVLFAVDATLTGAVVTDGETFAVGQEDGMASTQDNGGAVVFDGGKGAAGKVGTVVSRGRAIECRLAESVEAGVHGRRWTMEYVGRSLPLLIDV